jgi:membrane protease YdiL (CAAX protease family)
MNKPRGAFLATLLIAWIALGAAGIVYAHEKDIAIAVAGPMVAAFLVETPFYLVAGFAGMRERLAGPRLPAWLLISAVLPYIACCCGAFPFNWTALVRLIAMALVLIFWFRVLPSNPVVDLGYLAIIGAIIISGFLVSIYPPYRKIPLEIVGHITVVQIAVMVTLLDRRVPETGFGFWPTGSEWRAGFLHFLYFVALAVPLNLFLHATHLVSPRAPWKVAGTFFGALWFQALSEEFLFRGLLQPWIEALTNQRTLALFLTSAIFGLIHYRWNGGWKWALTVAVLGWACGHARNQTGGIRAGVVTHSLVEAAWRAFFS